MRDRLESARDRLERLRTELATARRVLAARLVEIYKADSPDALTVILEADGFGDLLERAEFLDRISDQDREITDEVRGLRDKARGPGPPAGEPRAARAARGGAHPRASATRSPRRRTSCSSSRNQLAVGARRPPRRARPGALEPRCSSRATSPRSRPSRRAWPSALSGAPGPIKPGSGQLIWPVNGPVVSPFGMRWGRLHAGLDIAVPAGTPIRAADSGTVVLMGWVGGYGNYTCIQHTASLSTCYGHQSSFATSNGANVSRAR